MQNAPPILILERGSIFTAGHYHTFGNTVLMIDLIESSGIG